MTTMSKPIIIGAAVPALLLMGAGCGESDKKCSQITSKAQCGKGCQWKPNNATSACKQNNTMFNQFFDFSEASDFFYQQKDADGKDGKPKTVHDLKEEVKKLRAELDVQSKDHNDDLDVIEWKEWLIEQKTAGGHDLSKSEEVFKRCAQANGIWRRQLEDAQTNRTAVYPIQYQEFVDEFKTLYAHQELSFQVHLPGDGAGLRNYLRTTGTAAQEEKTGKITLKSKDDKVKHDIVNEEDFNRLGVVLNAMSDKCHNKGGLVSKSRAGDIACVTLPEYLKREDHADSIDDQHQCEEANKNAQKALYDGKTKKEDDSIPTLFKWEDKCVVAQPCELIWKNIDDISASVDKEHKYCKAKLDRKTEDTNVQCTFDIPRKGNECVVDNKRKICGHYGTQSPDELEIGAGICQLVNADAADSPGHCSDVVKKDSDSDKKKKQASDSDSDKKKKKDKGRV